MESPGPDTPFAWALARRHGDDAAVARLYALKDERHLSEDDPLWEFIDLQEGYLDKYQAIAQQWAAASRLTRHHILVILGLMCMLVGLVGALAAAAGWWAYGDGWEHGHHEGYEAAQSEFAQRYDLSAAAWAMTSQGRRARELARDGLLSWAASQEAREMRRLGPEGFAEAALKDLEDQGLAMVARDDAQWLASPDGQRARALSEDGSLDWLSSSKGQLAQTLSRSGRLDWLISESGNLAYQLSTEGSVGWLVSQAGAQARTASEDGRLAWLFSKDGQSAWELSQNGIFNWALERGEGPLNPQLSARLQALPEQETQKWIVWLGALLGTGVLHDGVETDTPPTCSQWSLWGYRWKEIRIGYHDYCQVSPFGKVFVRIRRG